MSLSTYLDQFSRPFSGSNQGLCPASLMSCCGGCHLQGGWCGLSACFHHNNNQLTTLQSSYSWSPWSNIQYPELSVFVSMTELTGLEASVTPCSSWPSSNHDTCHAQCFGPENITNHNHTTSYGTYLTHRALWPRCYHDIGLQNVHFNIPMV